MIDYKKICKWELGRYYEKLLAICLLYTSDAADEL